MDNGITVGSVIHTKGWRTVKKYLRKSTITYCIFDQFSDSYRYFSMFPANLPNLLRIRA